MTRSPATMPWPSAPSVTAASPVTTPARARGARRPRCGARRRASRSTPLAPPVRHRLRGRSAFPTRHHRVTDELLDGPAVSLDTLAREVEVPVRNSRTSSASRPSERAVRPTRSANTIETRRRSDAGAAALAGSGVSAERAVDRKRGTTLPAEPLPGRVRRRARAADHLEGRSALAAELLALDVDVAAGGAGHAVTFSWLRAPSSRASQGDAPSCSKISRASSRSAVSPVSSPCSSSVTASQKTTPSSRNRFAAAS